MGLAPVDYQNVTDEELAACSVNGSLENFGQLVDRYTPRIYGFVTKRLSERADVEDVVQDIFITAWRKLDQFSAEHKFSTWIFTIASRTVISHYRHKKDDREHEADTADYRNPALILDEKENSERIWNKTRSLLTDDQFTAIWLKYAENMNIKEIAKVMNKTGGHVKLILFRARSKLANGLEPLLNRQTRTSEDFIIIPAAAKPGLTCNETG